jgi:hypothetical protein
MARLQEMVDAARASRVPGPRAPHQRGLSAGVSRQQGDAGRSRRPGARWGQSRNNRGGVRRRARGPDRHGRPPQQWRRRTVAQRFYGSDPFGGPMADPLACYCSDPLRPLLRSDPFVCCRGVLLAE